MSKLKIAEEPFKGATSTAESSSCACAGIFGSSRMCEAWWR
jgi:hypothetical protein